jgi:GNAT superfamily N-acetyltransferase
MKTRQRYNVPVRRRGRGRPRLTHIRPRILRPRLQVRIRRRPAVQDGPLVVTPVRTRGEFRTFFKFPWALYKGNPYWVPPLVSMQRRKLDRHKNPTWRHMQGKYYIAWRGTQAVGTIAAFINHRHNEFQGEHIGFFGAFHVYDDPEAATALLDTAAEYVRALGYDAIRGPATFSINDECGILIKGFDDAPVPMAPYNYPYYQRLIEHTPGFHKVMDLHSYSITLQASSQAPKFQQMLRVTQRNNERRGIVVRPIHTRRRKKDLQILKTLYNSSWDNNWGFVPLSESELDALVSELAHGLEPRLSFIAEVRGEPAALLLAFPDLNQPLHPAYPRPGKPEIVSTLQVLWHWKLRSKINRIRIPLMGVLEPYRGIGVEAALFLKLYEQAVALSAETGWEYADAGWVLENNEPMRRLVEAYSGDAYKHYRLYEARF